MSQLYVPDDNWVLCTEGKKVQTIKVTSQNKTKISGKKKQATEEDRFEGAFYCLKTQSELSSVGAIAGAAIGSIGGPVGAGLGAIVGAGIVFFTGLQN